MAHKILRLPAVIELTGLSRSSIYLRMKNQIFPQSISLGDRAVGWLEEDINQWLERCIVASKSRGLV
ncbi:AlpA family transcriptional regulator [Thalassotalea psychrophila]|uniref:AlpA family transcriptional regulator n=1 Tax=Thalassotalea psychrophila TaxID=3065647 RepID=A0ABY9TPZ9_9GAMM|nr:AlpA family transcriptional regulator [Colwelliaceae bacterium SQ149]